jgi:hypothetical protein
MLSTLAEARDRARRWCREEYGMKRHGTTQRLPYEHYLAAELPVLQKRPAPSEAYDVPVWSEATLHRDQHAQVLRALYSLPRNFEGRNLLGKRLLVRADRSTVRFYLREAREALVKTHPRMAPGLRSTDRNDFPADKAAVALRDTAFLLRRADEYGAAIGAYARALLEVPLPWTRMRQVYALLGLVQRYGDERVSKTCEIALGADMISVTRLKRLLEVAPSTSTGAPTPTRLVPFARHLRPSEQYTLPLPSREVIPKGE